MTESEKEPFGRIAYIDQPGIVGARWWQESIAEPVGRRTALRSFAMVGGALAGLGAILAVGAHACSKDDDWTTQTRTALDVQKEYGWNFGATGEALTFDGLSTLPFERNATRQLAADLDPARLDLNPFQVPTLFRSPDAMPTAPPQGNATPFQPLRDVLRPMFTPEMLVAYQQGKALARLVGAVRPPTKGPDMAVVVDRPGHESVAFAAGAASVFEPVFLFDNWPHPRGVVPAHRTLAAALYFQPLFARMRADRPSRAPAMFVLDRHRLSSYTDDATQFDNRYVARLPSAERLRALDVARVLYVVPARTDLLELDDLNDAFVLYTRAEILVKIVDATMFYNSASSSRPEELFASIQPDKGPESGALPPFFYGGREQFESGFWLDYPWISPEPAGIRPNPPGAHYRAAPRRTEFSSGSPTGLAPGQSMRPSNLGTVPVIVALGTGLVLGAKWSRNGTWNRTGQGSWGGG